MSEKKTIVIYKSKYGSTKRYAQWIAEEVNADLSEASKVNAEDLKGYDTIVFGGSLHAVGITGIKVITNNFEKIKDKRIVVYAVGCSPERKETTKHVFSSNFIGEMQDKVKFFYLRGAFDYSKLDLVDKAMMNALKLKIKAKKAEELDEDSKGLLDAYDNPIDWTDKKYIAPVVEYING